VKISLVNLIFFRGSLTANMADWPLQGLLLATGNWQLAYSLTKKSGTLLNYKWKESDRQYYHASCKLPKASNSLHNSF